MCSSTKYTPPEIAASARARSQRSSSVSGARLGEMTRAPEDASAALISARAAGRSRRVASSRTLPDRARISGYKRAKSCRTLKSSSTCIATTSSLIWRRQRTMQGRSRISSMPPNVGLRQSWQSSTAIGSLRRTAPGTNAPRRCNHEHERLRAPHQRPCLSRSYLRRW